MGCKSDPTVLQSIEAVPRETRKKPTTDLTTPLLQKYPKASISYPRDTCLIMFIVDLLTTDRTRGQPRCLSADELIENVANYEILVSCYETQHYKVFRQMDGSEKYTD